MDSKNVNIFNSSEIYSSHKVSKPLAEVFTSQEYTSQLMRERLTLVEKYLKNSDTLGDLGCSTGTIIPYFYDKCQKMIGFDFCQKYLDEAAGTFQKNDPKISFVLADISDIPRIEGGLDCAYSFSTIYLISNFQRLAQTLFQTMNHNAFAVLDLCNTRSINTYCCKFYEKEDGYAVQNRHTIETQLEELRKAGFTIIEHRCFQILPLWAGKPKWLWPLLHPKWNDIMKIRIRGRMLDEWVSSLPLLRRCAFRHLVVCRKV